MSHRTAGQISGVFVAATALILAAGSIISLVGCSSHGAYTQERMNQAAERMAELKSGTEWQMAQQQYLAGDLDKALKSVDRSIELNGKVAKSHVLKGRILIEKGQLEEARASFLAAEKVDPKCVDAQYYLGIVHERFNEPEQALDRYKKAMEFDATNAQYVVAASEMMVHLGKVDEAEQFLLQHRADFQYNAAIRQSLGHIAMMHNDAPQAVAMFKEAELLAPDDTTVIEDLMRAQVASGQFADAECNIRKLLDTEEYKGRRDLLHLQAKCLMSVDRPVEARTILIGLTTDNEGARDTEAWVDLGNTCVALDDKVRLKNVASRLIATAPDRYEGFFLRAMCQRMEGDQTTALETVESAISRSRTDANPLLLKGMILQDLGKPAEAQRCFAAAVKLEPTRVAAQQLLQASLNGDPVATVPTDSPTTDR